MEREGVQSDREVVRKSRERENVETKKAGEVRERENIEIKMEEVRGSENVEIQRWKEVVEKGRKV